MGKNASKLPSINALVTKQVLSCYTDVLDASKSKCIARKREEAPRLS